MSKEITDKIDPLDMNQYKMERLPVRSKTNFELWLAKSGIWIALAAFIFLLTGNPASFLTDFDSSMLSKSAAEHFHNVGLTEFSWHGQAMLAIFCTAVILWITEPIPNYLTSLMVIIALVLTGVLPERQAYAQLGHPIMWLNILSFILASMLVSSGAAKRFALWFICRFGTSATPIFYSFMVINLALSAFISATTAKAAILMPIFMVIAAVYGARGGENKNNFGRNLVLQNLLQINLCAGAFVTGSGANLLAASLIAGAIGGSFFFADWMIVAMPIVICMIVIGWLLATKVFFPLSPEERLPQIEGGMERLQQELDKMGKVSFREIKSIVIFVTILVFWATDKYHGVSATAIAFIGAIVALSPRIGVVNWNQVDVPWHLLLFSAGAYTLGAGFKQTDLPNLAVNFSLEYFGLDESTPFSVFYIMLTGAMLLSSLVFQSKTMRTMLFVPIAIGIAQRFDFPIMSLALPVALLIEHVYVLPFNSKPALLLYSTDQYSLSDSFKFGFTMLMIGWATSILMGETWFKWLGYAPNGVFW
ncbi:DASS family sodium-coupled anion symporter [Shewanella sp. 1_MG-2023]|uniref:SLC13 family permease n=1 Tax=unclassified Shewanella TaxID=196818 RepID=UPI000C853C82|nr:MULTISPECIES: DASS family sodium-coupled anion symporter [unclassified Shewanella]MDO6612726.1 DASS family sodium-coupled anion symporter [Shewanella sp. 7_MG-2023]MDO6772687.1 DASS family sodium-coupled anion symporter [Shewanella sp. 2_MG-2023]MDO6794851.1 DASS family sodium-coupled anion symporter [Shewanella sp. 1_MG-2023]PMG75293.1 sodium:sulfate symporter [Shewanella sp. 10N.286.51.B7]